MATATIQKIGSGFLAGGATTTKIWKNPPAQNVLSFWAAPRKLGPEDIFTGPVSFQVTSAVSKMDSPDHFVVEVHIKNAGSIGYDFELFMSFLA